MLETFDPYYLWLGIPPREQPPHHYRLLGVDIFEPDPDVIANAADKQMAHIRSFQAGPHSAMSQKLLNELAAAKICLLNSDRRLAYDQQLQQQVQLVAPEPPRAPSGERLAMQHTALNDPPRHDVIDRRIRLFESTMQSSAIDRPPASQTARHHGALPYAAEISRVNPTCFLFLVDQSGSMAEPFGGESGKTKAQGVADAINRLFQTLVSRCAKGAYILDRYYIGAIGYGGDLCLGHPTPVSVIGKSPLRIEERVKKVEDPDTKLVEDHRVSVPVWFEPKAHGKTLMCEALEAAHDVVQDFVSKYPGCFPPIVINITDGKPSDGDPRPKAIALREVASQDGNTLLFNVHISARGEKPILFPSSESGLPDDHARLLFRMSSPLPSLYGSPGPDP